VANVQSLEMVVWDQGDDFWDEEDGDFPYPFGVFSSHHALGLGFGL
jgi:hypothetical protein